LKIAQEKLQQTSTSEDHLATIVSQLQTSRREITVQKYKLEKENKHLKEAFSKLKLQKSDLETQVTGILMEKQNVLNEVENLRDNLSKVFSVTSSQLWSSN